MTTLTVNFFEIQEIAEDLDREEHCLLWSDGDEVWDIFALYDYLREGDYEAELDDVIELTAVDLSEKGWEDFIKGFCDHAPHWYLTEDGEPIDRDFFCPWCAPWKNKGISLEWFQPDIYTAYGMGKAWAEKVRPKMDAVYSQMLEALKEELEECPI